jgi:hypothetical protein
VAQDDCQLPLRPLQWLQFFQAGWGRVTLHVCCWGQTVNPCLPMLLSICEVHAAHALQHGFQT